MIEFAPDPLHSLHDIKRHQLDRGVDLIDLSMINPDLAPPRFLLDKLMEATAKPSNHRYAVSRGVRRLRNAFADRYRSAFGVTLDPEDEVCATMGSKDALSVLLRLMRGSVLSAAPLRVLVGAPTYPGFISALTLHGCQVEYFDIVRDTDRMASVVADALNARRHQLLVLNFPNNPTGTTVDSKFYDTVLTVAQQVGTVVYNDFVYGELEYNSLSATSILNRRTQGGVVESYSISKAYSAPGWRIAALVGDPKIIALAARLKSIRDYGVFLPLQIAAAAALSSKDDLAQSARDTYRARARLMSAAIHDLGWKCEAPQAGSSIWTRVSTLELAEPVASEGGYSFELAERILKERSVYCLPGQAFGTKFAGYLRLALVCSEERIREVSRRLNRFELGGAAKTCLLYTSPSPRD